MYRTLYGQPPETVDEQRGKPRPEIDVAFIGESIVEAMDGRWLGKKIVRAVSRNSEGEDHKLNYTCIFIYISHTYLEISI